MKVSLSWLRDYLDLTLSLTDLVDGLTMAGLEVDAVHDRYRHLDTVVVGRVTAVESHPKADKLTICQVEAGRDRVAVVCGAPNVAVGIQAPLALPGTVLPDGTVIKASRIRGVRSHGMLCSAAELDLGDDRSGLMVLDGTLAAGDALATALDLQDAVIELELTPNRPDCLSVLGVAREIAALQGTASLRHPDTSAPEGEAVHDLARVTVEDARLCPRYTARVIEGLRVAPSPPWLQDRLRSVGQRPINNIVDITNFVMLEMGQPLHAFDYDRVADHHIIVRRAGADRRFTTLDGKARELTPDMLLICDGRRPVGIAGVMGGLDSEIGPDSRTVLIEGACFDPVSVRRTAKALGLNTDAAHRFERGTDPDGTLAAVNRAAVLMAALGGGRVAAGAIDVNPHPHRAPRIELSVTATNALLGTTLTAATMRGLLTSIAFRVENETDETLLVRPPSFRVDVRRPEDLMEEVARRYGYDRIPVTYPQAGAAEPIENPHRATRGRIREAMCGQGFDEVINYSFIGADAVDRLNLAEDDPRRDTVAILNPISEDQAVMRTSLLPGLLETTQRNLSRQNRSLRLFEIGRIYRVREEVELPAEIETLALLWTGRQQAAAWHTPARDCDFYDLKGAVEGLLAGLRIRRPRFTALPDERCRYTAPGQTACIAAGGHDLGLAGRVHPRVAAAFGLKQPAYVAELDADRLHAIGLPVPRATALSRFPAVVRDLSVIVDEHLEAQRLRDHLLDADENLVEDVALMDVFREPPVPAGKKSLTLRVTYRAPDGTLEDSRINRLHGAVAQDLLNAFDAGLPA